jgi:hypothetical protein
MEIKGGTRSPELVSVFSRKIVITVFYSLMTSVLLPTIVWYIFTSGSMFDIIGGIVVLMLVLFIWLVMVWGELRLKAIRISFTDNDIVVKSFLGIGNAKKYSYDSITGFQSTLEPALPLPYECIRLMNNQKQVLYISQYYFTNYHQLKVFVIEKFENDGVREFSLKKTFLEIFNQ